MKRKAPSMNLIIVLAMTALIVGALAGAVAIFLRTYRAALIRNAETTSRQVIAQVSGTMERFLQDTNDSMKLLSGYLDLLSYIIIPCAFITDIDIGTICTDIHSSVTSINSRCICMYITKL